MAASVLLKHQTKGLDAPIVHLRLLCHHSYNRDSKHGLTSTWAGGKLHNARFSIARSDDPERSRLLIDLHTHTYPRSDDSFMTPDELVEAAKGAGLDGVCITEHDHFWDPFDIVELSKRHNFLVLPGCEINTDGGHLLVYGLNQYVFGMHKPDTLWSHVERAGGVIVAAHPYRRRYLRERGHVPDYSSSMVEKARTDRFFSYCDSIEAFNGRADEGENAFSVELAQRLGLGMVGASDSHRVTQLGGVATEFSSEITCLDHLIVELRAGRCRPVLLDTAANIMTAPSTIGAARQVD